MGILRLVAVLGLGLGLWAWAGSARPPSPAAPAGRVLRVVCLGDSLTGGHGVPPALAYPARVEALLAARGVAVAMVNAGISGHTAAQGLARLPALLEPVPDLVLVELGANDGLRGRALEPMRQALEAIVVQCRARGARVALAGMRLPPGVGDPAYRSAFEAAYAELAAAHDLPLLPFLLEGVAGKPALNQPDRLHPNADGQAVIAGRVADFLEPILAEAAAGP